MIGNTSIHKLNVVKLVVPEALLLSYIGKHHGSLSARNFIRVKNGIKLKYKKFF